MKIPTQSKLYIPVIGDPFKFTATKFKRERENLSHFLYFEINHRVMQDQLPKDMEIRWSKTLNKTAGRFVWTKEWSQIQLSTKVLDNFDRLRLTLAHEMCHAADILIDNLGKPPHGKNWLKWTKKVHKVYPDIRITTKHHYDITFKHWYGCSNENCDAV